MVKELNGQSELTDFIKKGMTIVDFWAPWCGPCRMLAPAFEDVSNELKGKIAFAKLNIEEHQEVSGEYGIQSIPCLIIFSNGTEKTRITGLRSKEELKKLIEAAL